MQSSVVPTARPLTTLSEEEALFRTTVQHFAADTMTPLVAQMDENAQYDAALIPALFQLGLMGIEIPEVYGGAGGSFFMSCLAIEEFCPFGLLTFYSFSESINGSIPSLSQCE